MKISTVASPSAALGENVFGSQGHISTEALARAKATAAGQATPEPTANQDRDPQVRRLKMNVQRSTDRREFAHTEPTSAGDTAQPAQADEVQSAPEVTKQPLDPQLAAIAKQRRALQVKEKEIAEREAALAAKPPAEDWKSRLKQSPLSVLQEAGVSYDDLTQAILASPGSQEVVQLREELKALKEGVDTKLTERETAAEKQALAQIEREIGKLTAQGVEFETIRATNSQSDVRDLIHRTWKTTGELLSESEACMLVEKQLIEELMPLTKLSKIAAPSAEPQQKERQTTTLTNRDTSRAPTSRRERALIAFYGTK